MKIEIELEQVPKSVINAVVKDFVDNARVVLIGEAVCIDVKRTMWGVFDIDYEDFLGNIDSEDKSYYYSGYRQLSNLYSLLMDWVDVLEDNKGSYEPQNSNDIADMIGVMQTVIDRLQKI